jgi:hypothetical protein
LTTTKTTPNHTTTYIMNLWVKRAGQLLVVALLLISCEDDSFLLGFKNQNKKFKGTYQEFLLGEWGDGTVFNVDTVYTDDFDGFRVMIGKYNDPVLGLVEATGFAEFRPTSVTKLDESSVYDSVTFQMHIDYYSYALTDKHVEKFSVHRITGGPLAYYANEEKLQRQRYLSSSTVDYDPTPLGLATVEVNIDSLKKNLQKTTGFDTILAKARLDDTFGQELFNLALNNPGKILDTLRLFRNQMRGLAFVPDASSTSILGYATLHPLSKITIHYHTMKDGQVKDTLSRAFSFDQIPFSYPIVSFNNISVQRPGGYPSPEFPYQGTTPSVTAIQSGSGLAAKIDMRKFYEFADTIDNLLINSAELIIESVDAPAGLDPINYLEMRVTKEDNRFYNFSVEEDREALNNYVLTVEEPTPSINPQNINKLRCFYQLNDLQTAAFRLAYNSTKKNYAGFMTLALQNIFDNKSEETRIEYLSLYPAGIATKSSQPSVGKMVNRTVFNKNAVKLRIYYTTPNTPNL